MAPPKPTTASSSKQRPTDKKPTIPRGYNAKDATLSYQVQGSEDATQWTPLADEAGQLITVGPIVFENSITIGQATEEAICTFTLLPTQYKLRQISKGPDYTTVVEIDCKITPKCEVRSLVEDHVVGMAKARELPLARVSPTITAFRLTIKTNRFTAIGGVLASTPALLLRHLTVLTTGKAMADPEAAWSILVSGDLKALTEESKAQEKQLGLFKGCRIRTRANAAGNGIFVEVFPGRPQNAEEAVEARESREYDFESHKVGLSYVLKAPSLFPEDIIQQANEEGRQGPRYNIFGQPDTARWELAIVKNPQGFESSVVGVVQNSFGGHSLDQFLGEEENVALEPIHNNILGERAASAEGMIANEVNAYEQLARGFLKEADKLSLIPVRALFGGERCNPADNELLEASEPIPDEFKGTLNPSQAQAMQMNVRRKISVTFGPPGTGKSFEIAMLLRYLLVRLDETAILTAMANVAVDALLLSCDKVWRKNFSGAQGPFARVYSEAQIMGQWAAGEVELLNSPYHIDHLRYKLALQQPAVYGDYLSGRRTLEQFGLFTDEESFKAYRKGAKKAGREALRDIKAVFCTIAGCQSTLLYETGLAKAEDEFTYPATTVVIDEAGTVQRPFMMIPVMTFLTTRRLVLTGDPFQLPALLLSSEARKLFPKSWLKDIIDRNYPEVFLNHQYRMYDTLYAHLPVCIYNKPITSEKSLTRPGRYLQTLMSKMPLHFGTGDLNFTLNGYFNMIDTPGVSEVTSGGSSFNMKEAEVVNSLVLALINVGVPRTTIAVITGYTAQKGVLKTMAQEHGWSDIRIILTIDSSQGSEYETVILSLVRTSGDPGFMGKLNRSCVGTSRQMEAMFIIGKWDHWQKPVANFKYLTRILLHMNNEASAAGRAPFVIASGDPTPPQPKKIPLPAPEASSAVAKGKEKASEELSAAEASTKLEQDAATMRQIKLGEIEDRRKKLDEAADRRMQEAMQAMEKARRATEQVREENEKEREDFNEQVRLEMEELEQSIEEEKSSVEMEKAMTELLTVLDV